VVRCWTSKAPLHMRPRAGPALLAFPGDHAVSITSTAACAAASWLTGQAGVAGQHSSAQLPPTGAWQEPSQGAATAVGAVAHTSKLSGLQPLTAAGAAASSQRRLHQADEGRLEFTGLLLDPLRLGATLLKASKTNERYQAAAKAAEPARQLLLRRQRVGAAAVDGYAEVVWRDAVRPVSFDVRTLGILTPPKDQGRCAACVAFAITSAAEASIALVQPALARAFQQQGGLSPQQLYFCQADQIRSCKQVRLLAYSSTHGGLLCEASCVAPCTCLCV